MGSDALSWCVWRQLQCTYKNNIKKKKQILKKKKKKEKEFQANEKNKLGEFKDAAKITREIHRI
jgi:hypothetical protein